MEWGGEHEQYTVVDWHLIETEEDARTFAAKIAAAPLRHVQRTSISSALVHATSMMKDNGYQGLRRVIDISGDGPNNQGGLVTASRDAVLASGVTINGLPLMLKKTQRRLVSPAQSRSLLRRLRDRRTRILCHSG